MVFRFRAVFSALSSLRCASGPAGARRICLHSGGQLALSSLAPAAGPFSLFSGILFLSLPLSLMSYLCLPYVVMVRGCSLVRCESLAIRYRKRKSRGRFASVNWGNQTGCVGNWLGRPQIAGYDIIALYAQCAHFAHFTSFAPGFGLGPNLGPDLAPLPWLLPWLWP